ncbi:MAG: hypothetical protein ABW026_18355 [Microvirga sp.]
MVDPLAAGAGAGKKVGDEPVDVILGIVGAVADRRELPERGSPI